MLNARGMHAVLLAAVFLLGGCAAGRSLVTAKVDAGANPSQGQAVRIESVEDARVFSMGPPSADMPSLMNDAEIKDKAIASRAIARKRGGFGAALGDVLLPEGETVQMLTEAAVSRALRDAGYRVLASGEAGHEQAIPVTVRIEEFWSWFSPGFASVAVSFRGKLLLRGALAPIEKGQTYSAEVRDQMQAVFESDWAAIVSKGLDSLLASIKQGLIAARPAKP